MDALMYLIAISLVIACTSASFFSLAAYEASRNKPLACLGLFSAAYAIEQALILYNEYRTHNAFVDAEWGSMEDPILHTFLGAILGQSLWMATLQFFGENRVTLKYGPLGGFIAMSMAIVVTPSIDPSVQKYLFYTLRQLFFLATSVFFFIKLRNTNEAPETARYRRKAPIMKTFSALVILVLLEDFVVMLLFTAPEQIDNPFVEFVFRRNVAEIILCLCIAGYSIHYSLSILKLRQEMAALPAADRPSRSSQANDSLAYFSSKYGLSAREKEILSYMLDGKTNQQIAQALQVSLGTVKTHTHHIFKKVGVSNRIELSNRFWSESL